MSFFEELKRRNVFRVGIAYAITAWLLIQVTDILFESIGAPPWVMQTMFVVLGVGFVIALFFAWAFELTPDGVKRESEIDRSQSIRADTGHKLDRSIIVILVIALAYFVWESRYDTDAVTAASSKTASVTKADQVALTSASERQSVAVLPFVNMSSDPEQEYFSDGITEEIINALVKIPGLSVPARTSVFGFKGQQGDVRQIGEQLGVAHVLEGSIRTQGKQVRITAQLIKVNDGFHLWSETFDRELVNIFVVQEEIATAIAAVLVGELGLAVETVPNQTLNMEAYDLYLQGRALLRTRDEKTIEVLEEATRSDPGFAPAWAILAIAYEVDGQQEMAMKAAEKALQLDPDNVDALDALASVLRSRMRWQEAGVLYDRAIAIDPQSAELLEDYAEFLSRVGHTDKALKVTRQGFAIDPNLLPLTMAHMEALLSNGHLADALELVERVISEDPEKGWMRFPALPVFLAQADISADDEWIKGMELPADVLPTVTAILANPNASDAKEQLKMWYSVDSFSGDVELDRKFSLAGRLLAWAGDSDYVLDVELAILHQSPYGLAEWGWTPDLSSVRQNPRFEEYLQLAGLIEYWDATEWPQWCWRNDNGRVECK